MLSVMTNNSSNIAQNSVNKNADLLSNAMERLSTGLRINSAADDAAGLQIATRMNANVTGMETANRNVSDATSMLQTADGSLDELNTIANRMKELTTQAANGVNTSKDLVALNNEFKELGAEMVRIVEETTYAGNDLFGKLDGTGTTFQIGAGSDETLNVGIDSQGLKDAIGELAKGLGAVTADFDNRTEDVAELAKQEDEIVARQLVIDAKENGLDKTAINTAEGDLVIAQTTYDAIPTPSAAEVATLATAKKAVTDAKADFLVDNKDALAAIAEDQKSLDTDQKSLDKAKTELDKLAAAAGGTASIDSVNDMIDTIGEQRSDLGANINRLGHTASNLANVTENTKAASGRIMDADFAAETASMTKNQLLVQAGTKILSSANQNTGLVMGLLR